MHRFGVSPSQGRFGQGSAKSRLIVTYHTPHCILWLGSDQTCLGSPHPSRVGLALACLSAFSELFTFCPLSPALTFAADVRSPRVPLSEGPACPAQASCGSLRSSPRPARTVCCLLTALPTPTTLLLPQVSTWLGPTCALELVLIPPSQNSYLHPAI